LFQNPVGANLRFDETALSIKQKSHEGAPVYPSVSLHGFTLIRIEGFIPRGSAARYVDSETVVVV
jgi:hypothetical protein